MVSSSLLQIFKCGVDDPKAAAALRKSLQKDGINIVSLEQEHCFNIELAAGTQLSPDEEERLAWLLTETFEPNKTGRGSFLAASPGRVEIVEVGPRLTFCTAWSSNAVSICAACGLPCVKRIERSRRYALETQPAVSRAQLDAHASVLYDRMTECIYEAQLKTCAALVNPACRHAAAEPK